MRALVVVPTYNERENIAEVVERLFAGCPDCSLLVIDDSSPDGTADKAREMARHDARISVEQRPRKSGLGSAYVMGFRWALERGFDAIVSMDADLSHDPAAAPRLLAALEDGADLTIGSRYVTDGGVSNWGYLRRALSRLGNAYALLWLRFGIRDSTSGFRAYRADAVRAMNPETIRSEGYAFQIETAWRVHQNRGRIVEVPITFEERHGGSSKLSRRIVLEALVRVPRWALAARRRSG